MKATRYLLLSLAHETLATARDTRHDDLDDYAQLTLTDYSRSWLTTPSESGGHLTAQDGIASAFDPLEALQDALEVMQSSWYELWLGTWPSAIDWTAAVVDTHLVSSLSTLSKALKSEDDIGRNRDVENDLNRYFSQNVRVPPFNSPTAYQVICFRGRTRALGPSLLRHSALRPNHKPNMINNPATRVHVDADAQIGGLLLRRRRLRHPQPSLR